MGLGGLIVQRFLFTHRNYASQVPFSYCCSTPESSAQVAKLGHIFSAVFSGDNNYWLPNRYRANEALMA